jgi:hypothetical protein
MELGQFYKVCERTRIAFSSILAPLYVLAASPQPLFRSSEMLSSGLRADEFCLLAVVY